MKASLLFRIAVLFSIVFSASSDAKALSGIVERVSDGDTLRIRTSDGRVKIRLAGIDAPEKAQAFGRAASRRLAGICLGKHAELDARKQDRYGRTVARVQCNGIDPSTVLLSEGLAWHYKKYAHEQPRKEWESDVSQESNAREKGLGLWADANSVPPWEFRKSAKNK